ncbi:MAG: endo-1,3-alpha-glucanase family glycosylhydrolase [Chloroflexota bacterium]|jgi:hypothetical protein
MRCGKLLVIAMLLIMAAMNVIVPGVSAAPDTPVLAFYYPWYSPGNFNRAAMWDVPIEPYESDSRATIERHVKEAKEAGINGFISSWMGKDNRTDKNFNTLLDVCAAQGFSATIYFETGSDGLVSEGQIVEQLRYVMSTYGAHPNYTHVAGKPAIFFWNPSAAGNLNNWRSIRSQVDPNYTWHWNVETDRPENWLDVFDGVHLFSAASWAGDATGTYKNLKSKVDDIAARTGRSKIWAAGVAPGWDNSRQSNPVQVRKDREGGNYYARRWESAIASNPGVVTITSWNEWGEGTEIEPGTSYGNLYLDLTRKYVAVLRQSGGDSGQTPVSTESLSHPDSSKYSFKLGFQLLAGLIPNIVGQPLEDEHWNDNGDSLQQTTNGLLVWRKADNWTAFTNGFITWINGPNGVQSRLNEQRFPWEAQ